jgi:hypothetical protein
MDDEKPIHLTTTEARGGTTEGVVRYVLAISVALTVLALAIVVISGVI